MSPIPHIRLSVKARLGLFRKLPRPGGGSRPPLSPSARATQSGEPASLAAWRGLCDASREAFEDVYRVLSVRLEERGESFYNSMLPAVVEVGRRPLSVSLRTEGGDRGDEMEWRGGA